MEPKTFKISADDLDRAASAAKAAGVSQSEFFRRAVVAYIDGTSIPVGQNAGADFSAMEQKVQRLAAHIHATAQAALQALDHRSTTAVEQIEAAAAKHSEAMDEHMSRLSRAASVVDGIAEKIATELNAALGALA